jgi:sugar (pentulose or hexulose) kinase
MSRTVVLGIDVGTSGVRVIAASEDGAVLAETSCPLHGHRPAPDRHEQRPEDWWAAVCAACRELAVKVEVAGLAVTSTSGTLVVTDAAGEPLRPALMYDDGRARAAAEGINAASGESFSCNASYSLAKAVWIRRHEPHIWERARWLLHPADWLAGRLSGRFGFSDYSNALKLGYEPEMAAWNPAVARAGVPCEFLPRVVTPGEQVGELSVKASEETSLPAGTPVLAGATDGIASLIASGAKEPGDGSTTLGTTLVWKALSRFKPDPRGGIYCHLHPAGLWAPGAASNSGPGSLPASGCSDAEGDARAAVCLPTGVVCYLLPGKGERFPFLHPGAETFYEGEPGSAADLRAAELQSLAFVERWGYELMAQCGVDVTGIIYSTGAASRSAILSSLRANVLGKPVARCCHPTAAFGAAILASSGKLFGNDLLAATRAMTIVSETHQPSASTKRRYDEIYSAFRDACARRGFGT